MLVDCKKCTRLMSGEISMPVAEKGGNSGTLFKTLQRLRTKDFQNVQEEAFSPKDFSQHFEKVSKENFGNSVEQILEILKNETATKQGPEVEEATTKGRSEQTFEEFEKELWKMRDGAPGIQGSMVSALGPWAIMREHETNQENTPRSMAGGIKRRICGYLAQKENARQVYHGVYLLYQLIG